jgi:hypothetical protein
MALTDKGITQKDNVAKLVKDSNLSAAFRNDYLSGMPAKKLGEKYGVGESSATFYYVLGHLGLPFRIAGSRFVDVSKVNADHSTKMPVSVGKQLNLEPGKQYLWKIVDLESKTVQLVRKDQ